MSKMPNVGFNGSLMILHIRLKYNTNVQYWSIHTEQKKTLILAKWDRYIVRTHLK